VSLINVVVAITSPDVKAEIIAEGVKARPDMNLVRGEHVEATEVDAILETIPRLSQCALVIVGHPAETYELAERWLAERPDIVVMRVDVVGDMVRIGVRPRLDSLLTTLRRLVEHVGTHEPGQVTRMQPRSVGFDVKAADAQSPPRSLMQASIDWVHRRLQDAVESVPEENGDVNGLCVTRKTLLQALDSGPHDPSRDLANADAALDLALANADPKSEPLAAAAKFFDLTPLEFRMMALALAPELDLRFQRCIGFLLDDISRRAGTIALFSSLLGVTARIRSELADDGALARWLVFEDYAGRQPTADEPLRVDLFLAQWILGDAFALTNDPRVRRIMRLVPWPGAGLLQRNDERARAVGLIEKLHGAQWILFGGDDPAAWRALLEPGAHEKEVVPIRVELARLAGTDLVEVEDLARRFARVVLLAGGPLIIDVPKADVSEEDDDRLRLFFAALEGVRCRAAVICPDAARAIRLLAPAPYELLDEMPLSFAARVAAVRAAAAGARVYLTESTAESIATQFPLSVDQLEHAMRLASSRTTYDHGMERFLAACREVASEGISHLAERLEPLFSLDEVVLPPDRKQQLHEIVDHVRFAPRVLDEWKFRDQLPYGRGVTALFHGFSGTGKTMAAIGIARELGIQILRLDLSKVVSKYIGDTEKNIDRVFTDAQRSGAAILIDEADALLGKRSEVKDAHDRYANIEVAYLLQRMEAYEGLAILTTNLRQNLDPAFVRRLRFVVDFPRPDAEARKQIWRQCLPEESHLLDDAAFTLLARKVDLTGGHIRQITLRAAFIAAAAGVRIGLEHIAQAARAEFAKLGMPPVEIDLARARRAA